MADLSINIAGINFKNPILTASGTFGYGSEVADLYDVSQLGGLVTKTITKKQRHGNPPERISETTAGMLNSIGLANVGLENFISDKLKYLDKLDTNVIVNIAGESYEDFPYLIERLNEFDTIKAFELNLSCPNVSGGLDFSIDPKAAYKVVKNVKSITNKPIIAKLTPNVTDVSEIAVAIEDAGGDIISLINTLLGMNVNIWKKKPSLSRVMGGLSGPAIKPIALAKVYSVCKKVKIPVIGIGGICTAEDAIEFFLVGASAIQLGTITFVDPTAPIKVIKGLNDYLEKMGLSSINDIIGALET